MKILFQRISSFMGFFSAKKNLLWLILLSVAVSIGTLAINWRSMPYYGADADQYIELAEGRPENVIKPFSSRILHPMLVRMTKNLMSGTTDQGFTLVACGALVLLVSTCMLILLPEIPFLLLLVPVMCTPFLIQLTKECYLPDLFHASLVALFLLMFKKNEWVATLILLSLLLTRESTILLSLCAILIYTYRHRYKLALLTVGITVGGVLISHFVGSAGRPNIHNLSSVAYLFLKVPFNFFLNVAGVQLWSNTLDYCTPMVIFPLPEWMRLGSVHTIGICGFNSMRPLTTMLSILTLFGIIPTLVVLTVARIGKRLWIDSAPWLALALLYGLLSFFVGMTTGSSVYRLVGYGWPAFWLAGPAVAIKYYRMDRSVLAQLLIYHTVVSWLPFFIKGSQGIAAGTLLVALIISGGLHFLSLKAILSVERKTIDVVVSPSFAAQESLRRGGPVNVCFSEREESLLSKLGGSR